MSERHLGFGRRRSDEEEAEWGNLYRQLDAEAAADAIVAREADLLAAEADMEWEVNRIRF